MAKKNKQLEEKVWLSHQWMTPSEVEAHMTVVGVVVEVAYNDWAEKAKYNSARSKYKTQ